MSRLPSDFYIGAQLGPVNVHLLPGLVDRYVELVGLPADAKVGEQPNCPPTILDTAMNILAVEHFRYRERGALNGKTVLRWFRPLPVGSTVKLRGELIDIYAKRGRDYFVIRYEVTDSLGELAMDMEVCNVVNLGGESRGIS